jgi:radical SAM protein with 4Fe4S-binding SPASM domain
MLKYFLSKIQLLGFQKSFLLSYELGIVPPPKFVIWDCTRRCNLNCAHCGAKKEKYRSELTTQQIKELVRRLSDYQIEYFVVTGGEPLLRQDLFEVFSLAKECGLKTGLATNGFFINENNSKIIAQVFDSIQISLDGPQEVHNKIRGNNEAFQKVIKAINLLRKNKSKQITISSVITPFNIKTLENLGEIVKKLEIDIWKIVSVMPIGKVENNDNLYLNQQEFLKLLNFIKENRKKLKIELGENLGYLGKYDKEVRNEPFFCPAGFLACCIGVNGNVRGCPEQPDIPYFQEGNVLEKDFFEIWKDGFKKYRDREFLQDETCRKCKFKNDCQGGCWIMRLKNINCSVRRYCL